MEKIIIEIRGVVMLIRLFTTQSMRAQQTGRTFYSKPHQVVDKNNQIQGIIFSIEKSSEHRAKNKEVLHNQIRETNLANAPHLLILHVLPTVQIDTLNDSVQGFPHLAAGIFTNDLTIVRGTGISKMHKREYCTPSYLPENLSTEELIKRQEYISPALFQTDHGVQASIFSPKDGGILVFANRYIIVLNLSQITNINIEEFIARVLEEKRRDTTYDRRNNHCCHSVDRALTGKNNLESSIDTQQAAVKLVHEITQPIDSIFSQNFYEMAHSSNLINNAPKFKLR